jgi:integrase
MRLDNRVARLTMPAGKNDVIFFDDALRGFGYRVRRGRRHLFKTWIVQYRAHGRTRRVLLGSADVLTVEQARGQAKKLLAKVALGEDPQGEREAARRQQTRTLRSVVEIYLAAKRTSLRPASLRVTKLYLTGAAYFGPLHSTPIDKITRADVASCLGVIARKSGTTTASRARSALSTLFAWAMGEGLCEANAVIGTNKPADPPARDRVLTDSELAAIWNACEGDDHGRIIRLLALTGARRQEIAGMRWSEIDLPAGTWTLPKERAKNGRALTLPLPPLALEIINTVPQIVGRDQLFGARAQAGFTQWDLHKRRLNGRLGGKVKAWRPHDLRRTVATRMADLGVQPHVIEAVLNHYSGHRRGVAGIYNRSPYEREMRAALALWADYVAAMVSGGERRVVAFPQQSA